MKTRIKMRVTPEQSKKVQEIIFSNGGRWVSTGKGITDTEKEYLSLWGDLDLTWCDNLEESEFEEVDADLFIRTNGTCEE